VAEFEQLAADRQAHNDAVADLELGATQHVIGELVADEARRAGLGRTSETHALVEAVALDIYEESVHQMRVAQIPGDEIDFWKGRIAAGAIKEAAKVAKAALVTKRGIEIVRGR
jgi:hypothetical protein